MDSSSNSPSSTQACDVASDLQKKECSAEESLESASTAKAGKNAALKENGHSVLNSINKSASQIKKPPRRKSASPVSWFPRKKADSYLKRKIRLLQEVGGMNSSLDETLGDTNPHYCRVEREKIAAREAARKAMEARKAAMVEASWCRILRAARIPSKEAESQLIKAEKSVTEAFEEAATVGVIMYDRPDCPQRPCEVETSSTIGGGSTHTVTASFETAFEVDKEVAAAVKEAFIWLANCPASSNKDEFRDLIRKISQNPEMSGTDQDVSEFSSECESDVGSELELEPHHDDIRTRGMNTKSSGMEARQRKSRSRKLPSSCILKSSPLKLVDMMLDRLKQLQEDELASLATIVATCGLNAALLEAENSKRHDPVFVTDDAKDPLVTFTKSGSRRDSNVTEVVPSLDKFLVKHVSRLEKEVQEAKNARINNASEESGKSAEGTEGIICDPNNPNNVASSSEAVPDLGSILVKHTSRFEKEIEEAKKSQRVFEKARERSRDMKDEADWDVEHFGKENIDLSKTFTAPFHDGKNITASGEILAGMGKDSSKVRHMSRIERAKLEALEAFSGQDNRLDKILVKSVHRLEKEKMQALASGNCAVQREQKKQSVVTSETLDKVLVKHVSRLEREKMGHCATVAMVMVRKKDQQFEKTVDSLDEILVKHQSRLQKEKLAMAQQSLDHVKHLETRREVREREMREAWGGLSLGNSIRPHLSKLERDKAAWKKAEEEELRRAGEH